MYKVHDEDPIRFISAKKEEPLWMLKIRLKALKRWEKMLDPHLAHLYYNPINYQSISYFLLLKMPPNSLDEVDPKILEPIKIGHHH